MDNKQIKQAKTTRQQSQAPQAWKPRAAGEQHTGQKCPYCGTDIKSTFVICPHCGRSLTPGKCSFCGAAMKPNAKFCTRCGQSREGIVCPECGTLNSRNFCRKCNAPLTPMAQVAVEAAKNDPAFKAIQVKAAELAELHARIEELRNAAETDEESLPQLSEADCALLDEYADILGSIGAVKPKPQAVTTPETPARRQYADITLSMDDIMAAYRSKAAEMDAALAALTPPPDFTPEQQRDYFSARKIGKVHTEYDMSGYTPSQWVCNFCGFRHNNPSECSEPQLGGTWIYVTPEQYVQENKSYLASQSSFVIE